MSVIDTYPAPPATVSPWATLRKRLDNKRAAETAAWREELGSTRRPKTAAELHADIARYNEWLQETTVSSQGALADWIRGQKAATLRQLAQLTLGGAK